MSGRNFRDDVEAHWKYTKKIIDIMVEMTHIAYMEGMVHGYKHGLEDKDK